MRAILLLLPLLGACHRRVPEPVRVGEPIKDHVAIEKPLLTIGGARGFCLAADGGRQCCKGPNCDPHLSPVEAKGLAEP